MIQSENTEKENNKNRKQLSKNSLIFIIWTAASFLVFGFFLAHYLGAIASYGLLGILSLILYFPLKLYLKRNEFGVKREDIIPVATGALGISFPVWCLVNPQQFVFFDLYGLFFVVTLSVSLFPLLNIVYVLLNKVSAKKEKDDKKSVLKIRLFYLIPLFFSFAFFFFIQPLDVFLNNYLEIPFSLKDVILSEIYFLPFLAFIVFLSLCIPSGFTAVLGTFFAALNICSYIQLMLFNKYTGEIIGGSYLWNIHPIYTFAGLAVWIIVFAVSLILFFNKKTNKIIVFINMAVAAMLSTGLIYSFVSYINSDEKKTMTLKDGYYLDSSEEFCVGKENVIFLIADAVDNSYVKTILADDPAFFDEFNDFTLYTNTCSVYDYSAASIAQFLYGYTCMEGTEKTKPFMERFKNNGYRFLMYEYDTIGVPGSPEMYIDNFKYSDEAVYVRSDLVRNNFAKISWYQLLPCILKQFSKVENINFDLCLSFNYEVNYLIYGNEEFDDAVNLSMNQYSDKCFMYYHIKGAHTPCDDYVGDSKYCLNIFKKYINQMKELGVYDDSVIIIAADHGVHDGNGGVEYPTPATPMFMIKGKDEVHDDMVLTDKPMYYRDIQATLIKYAGLTEEGDYELFGKTIDDYAEGEKRVRVWFDRDGNEYRKYIYCGDTSELERVVYEGDYEEVDGYSFDFKELDELELNWKYY